MDLLIRTQTLRLGGYFLYWEFLLPSIRAFLSASHLTPDVFLLCFLFLVPLPVPFPSLPSQLSMPSEYYNISTCAVFFFLDSLPSWHPGEKECRWLVSSIVHMKTNAQ